MKKRLKLITLSVFSLILLSSASATVNSINSVDQTSIETDTSDQVGVNTITTDVNVSSGTDTLTFELTNDNGANIESVSSSATGVASTSVTSNTTFEVATDFFMGSDGKTIDIKVTYSNVDTSATDYEYQMTTDANSLSATSNQVGTLSNPNYSGGIGTKDYPYKISTPEEFNNTKNNPGDNFELINDIDFSNYGTFTASTATLNSLNGNGYEIKNMDVEALGSDYEFGSGIYDNINTLRNIVFRNVSMTTDQDTGVGLISSTGENFDNITIVNSQVNPPSSATSYHVGLVTANTNSLNNIAVLNSEVNGSGNLIKSNTDLDSISNVYVYNSSTEDGYAISEMGNPDQVENIYIAESTVSTGELGDSDVTTTNVYYDSETTNITDSNNNGVALTTSEMTNGYAEGNMSGFDFTSVWREVNQGDPDSTGDGYPILRGADTQTQLESQSLFKEPQISTGIVDNLTYNSATLNGELDSLGTPKSVEVFIEYKKSSDLSWLQTSTESLSSTSVFSNDVVNLEPATDYNYRAVVEYEDGNGDIVQKEASTKTFTTDSYRLPDVNTREEKVFYTTDSATLEGELTALNDADTVEVLFEYREAGSSTWNELSAGTTSSPENFSADFSSNKDTEYEYRAVARTQSQGDSTGSIETFLTDLTSSFTAGEFENETDRIVIDVSIFDEDNSSVTAEFGGNSYVLNDGENVLDLNNTLKNFDMKFTKSVDSIDTQSPRIKTINTVKFDYIVSSTARTVAQGAGALLLLLTVLMGYSRFRTKQ